MKYVVATIGAIFIFLAVFFLTALVLTALAPNFLRYWINLGFVRTNNLPGIILGTLAGIASFRATLRRYDKKAREKE